MSASNKKLKGTTVFMYYYYCYYYYYDYTFHAQ